MERRLRFYQERVRTLVQFLATPRGGACVKEADLIRRTNLPTIPSSAAAAQREASTRLMTQLLEKAPSLLTSEGALNFSGFASEEVFDGLIEVCKLTEVCAVQRGALELYKVLTPLRPADLREGLQSIKAGL